MSRIKTFFKSIAGKMRRHLLDGCSRGVGLIEVLIALAIMGGVVVIVISTLSAGTKTVGTLDEISTAENIAQSKLEYTKSDTFQSLPATYDVISPLPANYSVTIEASAVSNRDANLQKIVVTVYHQGENVTVKEGYKVDR